MTKAEAISCIQTITLLKELAYNIHGYMDVIDAENCKKMIELLKEHGTPILTINDAVSELMDRHYDRLKEQEAVEPITEHHLFLCPVCKNTLFREQKFCHECGKRIEWEGR